MREWVRPRVLQEGLHVFATAMNGITVAVVDPLYPDELEDFLREHIASWKLEDTLRMTRVGSTITLERIDGGPRSGMGVDPNAES